MTFVYFCMVHDNYVPQSGVFHSFHSLGIPV